MLLGRLTPKFVRFCGALAIVYGLLLTMTPLGARADVPVQMEQGAIIVEISGMVRNVAGVGLGDIEVRIYRQQPDGNWGEVRSAYSDNSGAYATGPLETGLYRLRFFDPAGVYAFEYYGDQTTLAAASDIPVVGAAVPNVDVVLAAGGKITGSVRMYDGQIASSYMVSVYQSDGTGWQYLFMKWFPVVDPFNPPVNDGAYTIGGLAAGTYRLSIANDYRGGHYSEYYLNAADLTTATDIVVTAGSTTVNSDVILGDEKSRISGRVTAQDGSPLANIQITAYVRTNMMGSDSWMEVRSTSTDASGSYSMAALDAGTYFLRFLDQSSVYAFEYYNNANSLATAAPVNVPQDTVVANVDVVLAAGGKITGSVRMYDGQIASSYMVSVYQSDGTGWQYLYMKWFPVVDPFNPPVNDGVYTIGGLAAGTYRLSIANDYRGGHYSEYYLNAADLTTATDIVVTAGSTTVNSDVILGDEKSRISGRVTAQDGSPLANIQITAYVRTNMMGSDSWMEVRSTSTDASGSYSMAALDAGTYFLRFLDQSSVYAFEYYNNANSLATAAPVNVPQDTVVANVDVVLAAGGKITGSVRMYDGQIASSYMVNVYQFDGTGWQYLYMKWFPVLDPFNPPVNDGVYTIGGLAAGTYRLSIANDYRGGHYSEYYLNAADLTTATDIVVTAGSTTVNSDVILGDLVYTGLISGSVAGKAGPLPGIRVELYQDSGDWNGWWRLVYTLTGADGRYTIGGLRDGSYRVRFVDPNGLSGQPPL